MNTNTIPLQESCVSDLEVFQAFDLNHAGLEPVKDALGRQDLDAAKKELVHYFENRQSPVYFYDYRSLPLTPIDTDTNPYLFQASLGLVGSLKEFCLYAGKKLLEDHIYLRPGKGSKELELGKNYEFLPHFNFYEDQGKRHRSTLNIFVRGQFLEYLAVWYHETGEQRVLDYFQEILQVFFENYPLTIECARVDASHFSMTEDRDVMSAGWLSMVYTSLLYTRVPYEIPYQLTFEIIKRIWFLGIQFRRFDEDTYRKFNHHLWERGLLPFMLGTLFPEIPDFAAMREHGADVTRHHIRDDFNEDGGYSEHSIGYWSGAAVGEMLSKGILLARLNNMEILDQDTGRRMMETFQTLALISPPCKQYPSLGDNGGPMVNPLLWLGKNSVGSPFCEGVLKIRQGETDAIPAVPLDYCNERTGFFCSKSGYGPEDHYILMSAKVNSGDTGHNHMDLLSLFVTIHGQEFIGEPHSRQLYHGSPIGSSYRGYMYNMESHNTVLAYGKPVEPNEMYALKWGVIRPDTPVSRFETDKDGCFVSAYHNAYTFCRHTRKILSCRQKGFLIRDELFGGDRLQKEHIQRWHLFPDVAWTKLNDKSILLEKNGAKMLCIWSGAPRLHVWKKEELCPDIISDVSKLSTIIDACFSPTITKESRIGIVPQDLLILDMTGKDIPEQIPDIDDFCRTAVEKAEHGDLTAALEQFIGFEL